MTSSSSSQRSSLLPPTPTVQVTRPRVTSASTIAVLPSPKRLRQTPPPPSSPSRRSPCIRPAMISGSSTASATSIPPSSSRSRSRPTRPTLADKRAVTFDRHVMTSPYRSGGGSDHFNGDQGLVRRRELSVPILSQTLSHFSLTHTSPPTPLRQARATHKTMTDIYTSQPMDHTRTPRNQGRRYDWGSAPPFPSELSYPSTAPLPQATTFLGSPFSSKNSRDQYRYHGPDESPSRGYYYAKTERIPQGAFQKQLDWMQESEWMVDSAVEREEKEEISPLRAASRGSRSRRDTSGSSSSMASMDEYSGSGTSSASLLSLGRSSDEHRVRPGVAIWGEHPFEEEEPHPETPSRPLFVPTLDSDDALQISVKGKKATPSPATTARGRTPEISPLQHLMDRSNSKSVTPTDMSVAAKLKKSPFSSFIPRLMSVRKPKSSRKSPVVTATYDEDEATDTEDHSSPCNRHTHPSSSTLCDTPTVKVGPKDTLIGLGISSADKANSSFSSESSIEIPSPSKPPSKRTSHIPLASLTLTPGPLPPRASGRRKTMAAPAVPQVTTDKSASTATAMTMERAKPLRPFLRRGITEPRAPPSLAANLLHPNTVQTPPTAFFDDIKPSPAAFASTGLVKKKSAIPMLEIPKFGVKSSPVRVEASEVAPRQPTRCHRSGPSIERIQASGKPQPIGNGVPPAVAAAQRTRGLRRKGSTMFTSSGSCGSIGETKGFSPVTPTKPVLQITPFSSRAYTPLPATPTRYYPFASSSSVLSIATPPAEEPLDTPVIAVNPTADAVPGRMKSHKGPIARASNPMLVAAYKAGEQVDTAQVEGRRNRLEKDFVLVQSLGVGAFSQVWKVKDKAEGRLWAVKAGKPYTGVKNRLRQLEEVSILHSLSHNPHPNVITFVDSWEHRNRLYLRTELAECGDLASFLEALGDTGGLGEVRCWKLLSELSSALSHVHSYNILHLDVKPSNVLITRTGSLKLADFGMSTISNSTGHAADLSPALPLIGSDGGFVWSSPTNEASIPGKIDTVPSPIIDREVEGDREYLCPEALGDTPVGRESDIYSLGILLLEAALNVVLPSNGDGWVKLRNDDFSDLGEHYVERKHGDWRLFDEKGIPVISEGMMRGIKGMMRSDPALRWRLEDVRDMKEMSAVKAGPEAKKWGPACVEEEGEVLREILL